MHTGRHSEEAKLFASISCKYCMKLKQHFHYQFSIFTSFDETIQAYILYTTMHWFENLQKRCRALINFWRLDCSRTVLSVVRVRVHWGATRRLAPPPPKQKQRNYRPWLIQTREGIQCLNPDREGNMNHAKKSVKMSLHPTWASPAFFSRPK